MLHTAIRWPSPTKGEAESDAFLWSFEEERVRELVRQEALVTRSPSPSNISVSSSCQRSLRGVRLELDGEDGDDEEEDGAPALAAKSSSRLFSSSIPLGRNKLLARSKTSDLLTPSSTGLLMPPLQAQTVTTPSADEDAASATSLPFLQPRARKPTVRQRQAGTPAVVASDAGTAGSEQLPQMTPQPRRGSARPRSGNRLHPAPELASEGTVSFDDETAGETLRTKRSNAEIKHMIRVETKLELKHRRKHQSGMIGLVYRQRLLKEIVASRSYWYAIYMQHTRTRDACRRAGDWDGFERAKAALQQLNNTVHNPDFHQRDDWASERASKLLVKDLHLYCLYACANDLTIVLRDVQEGANRAFEGTFRLPPAYLDEDGYPNYEAIVDLSMEEIHRITSHEVMVRGKGIAVALKSSSYEPIIGRIPLDPRLSKVGKKLGENIRQIKLQFGDHPDAKLMMERQSAEADAQLLIRKYMQENQKALQSSWEEYERLVEAYNNEMMYSTDKERVSLRWLDRFNDARFLGHTEFRTIQGLVVHYLTDDATQRVARDSTHAPVFAVPKDSGWLVWDQQALVFAPDTNAVMEGLQAKGFRPAAVRVATYRQFVVDPLTKRIVEDLQNHAIIVPDYDGLAYCRNRDYPVDLIDLQSTDETNIQRLVEHYEAFEAESRNTQYVHGMGECARADVEHVYEVRALTDWKQNHGDEFNNLLKTQELSPGHYVAFESDGTWRILHDAEEIFAYYRRMWMRGAPLPLNPNWSVYLDASGLPVYETQIEPFDNSLQFVALKERIARMQSGWTIPALEDAYNRKFPGDRLQNHKLPRDVRDDPVFADYCRLRDENKLMKFNVQIRRQELQPPVYFHQRHREDHDEDAVIYLNGILPTVRERLLERRAQRVSALYHEFYLQKEMFMRRHGQSSSKGLGAKSLWSGLLRGKTGKR